MPTDVTIDGSVGEGGGQMVRSSLALSILTGKTLSLKNIRAKRSTPGLKRQHLTSVQAAARISHACLSPVDLGTTEFTFEPQAVQPGDYRFSVGSAGSASLVLQTILPPLLVAAQPARVSVEGGTHNQWAPPFDFLQLAYLPLINKMGPQVAVTLDRHGFYPAGGGCIRLEIKPVQRLLGLHLLRRGDLIDRRVEALIANLPGDIARREVDTLIRRLDWRAHEGHIRQIKGPGPGNAVVAILECQHVTEVFTACGRLGASAEKVAQEVASEVHDYLQADVPVGPHLADQLLLPLGISAWQGKLGDYQAGGSFRTGPLTQHSLTHIDILREFLGIHISVEPESELVTRVTLAPNAS